MLSKKRKKLRNNNGSQKRKKYLLWLSIALSGLLFILCGLLSQPRWMFSLATRLFPGALYAVDLPTSQKNIALTIDDGPSPSTQEILALLERYDVKATFFNISSYLPGHEATVQQSILQGHEIGNHLTADTASIKLSPEIFEANLLSAEAALLSLYPSPLEPSSQTPTIKLRWLRPGMGFYNHQMVRTAERHGYQVVLGSRFPYDTHIPSSRFASTFILSTVQPGDIVVLHDGENGQGDRTLKTLKTILPALQEKGYTITTLGQLEAGN
ncbi:MAG: chitin deacetylase family protein [Cyanobacteria bacterium J06650_10]